MRAAPIVAAFASALLLTGCGQGAEASGDALRKGNAYLAKHGNPDMNGMAVYMVDMGETWRLAYWYPEDRSFPSQIVVVDKKAGNVVHFEQRLMWEGARVP